MEPKNKKNDVTLQQILQRQKKLVPTTHITTYDVLAASDDLLLVTKTNVVVLENSLVKYISTSKVSDRGGRPFARRGNLPIIKQKEKNLSNKQKQKPPKNTEQSQVNNNKKNIVPTKADSPWALIKYFINQQY